MNNREAWLGVRLSQEDHTLIKEKADSLGLTMSEFVRRRCISDPSGVVIKADVNILRKLHIDLKRSGTLLNQIARELNTYHRPDRLIQEMHEAFSAIESASTSITKFIEDARNV